MSRNRDELKKGLPKLESMLIDFLLDSGIGPKHIKGNIVLQYAPKIQELCDNITKIRQTALKEIDGISETPADLEEAAEEYEKRVIEETKCHHNALTYAEGYEDALLLIPGAFIDGAKWDREQILEHVKLAYGKVSMNPFDCSEAFEELINKINVL